MSTKAIRKALAEASRSRVHSGKLMAALAEVEAIEQMALTFDEHLKFRGNNVVAPRDKVLAALITIESIKDDAR